MRIIPLLLGLLLVGSSAGTAPLWSPTMKTQVIDLDDVRKRRAERGRAYEEFLRVPAMSVGLYELQAGARDTQTPHEQDEVYHVLKGRAVFVSGDERSPVKAGSVVYVRRGVDHRFDEITEDLSLLVIFAAGPDAGD